MKSTLVAVRIPDSLVERMDAQGRDRSAVIRAALDTYLLGLERGAELSSMARIDSFQLLDSAGNVTHQGHVTRVTGP